MRDDSVLWIVLVLMFLLIAVAIAAIKDITTKWDEDDQ